MGLIICISHHFSGDAPGGGPRQHPEGWELPKYSPSPWGFQENCEVPVFSKGSSKPRGVERICSIPLSFGGVSFQTYTCDSTKGILLDLPRLRTPEGKVLTYCRGIFFTSKPSHFLAVEMQQKNQTILVDLRFNCPSPSKWRIDEHIYLLNGSYAHSIFYIPYLMNSPHILKFGTLYSSDRESHS